MAPTHDPFSRSSSSPRCSPRGLAWLAFLLWAWLPPGASAQRLLPDPPVLPGFGGLCDGGPLPCTRIDEIAFNAHADALFASGTDRRGLAFVTPYGLSIAVLERLEVGFASHTAVWQQGEDNLWQQGPLRFDMKGLLWPFRKEPHRHFSVAAAFEVEARADHFDGQNQLGLLTDLGALRLILNQPIGLAELGLVGGALWDWEGHRYVAGELGARAGVHLPWLDIKIFAEGLLRGVPAVMRSGDLQPIQPHGVLALGLISRTARAVDIAVVVHAGFGEGVAPFFVNLRLLDLGIGKGYPRPQGLLIEMGKQLAAWIGRQSIDPYLDQNCLLYDGDPRKPSPHRQPMARLGKLTADRRHCDWDGQVLPIGRAFWRDKKTTKICYDRALLHCFMERPGGTGPWTPVTPQPPHATPLHPGTGKGTLGPPGDAAVVGKDCYLRQGEQILGRAGTPNGQGGCHVSDGQTDRTLAVGQSLWPGPSPRMVCDAAGAQRPKWCLELPKEGGLTPREYVAGRFAGGVDQGVAGVQHAAGTAQQIASETAAGTPVYATTPVQEATAQAQHLLDAVRNASMEDAKKVFGQTVNGAVIWYTTIPPLEKAGDVAQVVGEGTVQAPVQAVVAGGVVKAVGVAGEVAGGLRKGLAAVKPGRVRKGAAVVRAGAAEPGFSFYDKPKWSTPVKPARREHLDRNLTLAGETPTPGTAAHHIVPWGEKSRDAARSRGALQRFGIDINAAENGVRLPNTPGCTAPGCYHPSVHTDVYYEAVRKELMKAKSREEALAALRRIKQQLLKGTFPH